MNLHVFQDSLGHYTKQTCERITRLTGDSGEDMFINIVPALSGPVISNVRNFERNWEEIVGFVQSVSGLKKVYFHCYNYYAQYLLQRILNHNRSVKFIWIFWSGEFYNLPEFLEDIYIGHSKRFIPRKPLLKILKDQVYFLKEYVMGRPYYFHRSFIRSFRHIHYFAGLLDKDFEVVNQYSKAGMQYVDFAYLSYDQFMDTKLPAGIVGQQGDGVEIMVNHSGDPTLNHIDALERLSKIPFNGKIVLPMAYGDGSYIKEVKEYAVSRWNNQVSVWDSYTEPAEYAQKLRQIDIAVFNSKIQQGMGNIIMLLWYGARLFFREENTVFQDLKKWGMNVYSVQHDLTAAHLSGRLPEDKVAANRAILKEHLSEQVVDRYYLSLINLN